MAVVLGVTDLTGYTGSNINGNGGLRASAMQFTAAANATVSSIEFYFNSAYDGDARVKLFLADSTGTILGITGAVVALAASGDAWVSGSITPVAITASTQYYLGWYCDNTYGPATGYLGIFTSATAGDYHNDTAGTYAAPPASVATLTYDAGVNNFAIRASSTGPSLATITSPIVDGATGDSGTYTGYTGTPNLLRVQDSGATYTQAMSNLSAAAGSFTFNAPDITLVTVDTAWAPYTTASYSMYAYLSDGTVNATKAVTRNPKTGYAVIEITGHWGTTTPFTLSYGAASEPALGSQIVYPTANSAVIDPATGGYQGNQLSGTMPYWFLDKDASFTAKPFTWNFDAMSSLTILRRRRRSIIVHKSKRK